LERCCRTWTRRTPRDTRSTSMRSSVFSVIHHTAGTLRGSKLLRKGDLLYHVQAGVAHTSTSKLLLASQNMFSMSQLSRQRFAAQQAAPCSRVDAQPETKPRLKPSLPPYSLANSLSSTRSLCSRLLQRARPSGSLTEDQVAAIARPSP